MTRSPRSVRLHRPRRSGRRSRCAGSLEEGVGEEGTAGVLHPARIDGKAEEGDAYGADGDRAETRGAEDRGPVVDEDTARLVVGHQEDAETGVGARGDAAVDPDLEGIPPATDDGAPGGAGDEPGDQEAGQEGGRAREG